MICLYCACDLSDWSLMRLSFFRKISTTHVVHTVSCVCSDRGRTRIFSTRYLCSALRSPLLRNISATWHVERHVHGHVCRQVLALCFHTARRLSSMILMASDTSIPIIIRMSIHMSIHMHSSLLATRPKPSLSSGASSLRPPAQTSNWCGRSRLQPHRSLHSRSCDPHAQQ